MLKDIGIVIPSLERNRYSPLGDLVKFGNSTLLEWKIIQLLKIADKRDIYVATPSEKIADIVKEYGVNLIKREEGGGIQDMLDRTIQGINRKYILWTKATSPFIGPKHYSSIIKQFLTLDENKYDSIITVLKMQEYIIYKKAFLNFSSSVSESRGSIEPVYKVTNSCSMAKKETCLKHKKDFGTAPFLFELDKFVAMEISEIDDDAILNDLLTHYFRRDLDIREKQLWKE